MFKIYISMLLCFLAVGCLGPSLKERRQSYQEVMDSWIGLDVNRYMRVVGYPVESRPLPNGNIVHIFQRSRTSQIPVYISPITTTVTPLYGGGATATTTGGQIYGSGTATHSCTTFIEAKPDGTIVFWRSEGNDCY